MTLTTYRDHPIRMLLAQLLEYQGRPDFAEPAIADNEQYAFARDKVFAIARLVDGLLEQTPATLASFSALSSLQSNIQSPLNELTAYLSNKNPSHIVNAAAQFEQSILPLLWGLPAQIASLPETSLAALMRKQSDSAAETIRQLSDQRDRLSMALAEVSTRAESLSTRLDSMQEVAAKERAEGAAAVANLHKTFAEKEIERVVAFEDSVAAFKNTFETFHAGTATKGVELIGALEDQKVQAARIVQVVGNIGVTGNYQQIANSEGRQANFWRWITVATFGAGVAVAGATFIKFWDQPFSTENLWSVAVRLLYAIAITAPAWYTARESARHRTNADRARQTELELASIGPFIELMPEEKKIEIRAALTPIYFGRSVDEHRIQSPVDAINIKDLAEVAKLLKK